MSANVFFEKRKCHIESEMLLLDEMLPSSVYKLALVQQNVAVGHKNVFFHKLYFFHITVLARRTAQTTLQCG